jgi:hypothetical protein
MDGGMGIRCGPRILPDERLVKESRSQNPEVRIFGCRTRIEIGFIRDSDFWIPAKPRGFANGSDELSMRKKIS